jgi:hypothetical protein
MKQWEDAAALKEELGQPVGDQQDLVEVVDADVPEDKEAGDMLPVQLHLPFHKPKQLNHSSDSYRHAMRILSICNIESRSATFYFACQKRKVHVGGHEERRV